MPSPTERPKCTWLCAGFILMGLAGIAGTARVLSVAIDKVASGRGLDTYHTVWLVEFNYIGVLVLFGAVLFALLAGGVLWLHDWWRWRSFEKKYRAGKGDN